MPAQRVQDARAALKSLYDQPTPLGVIHDAPDVWGSITEQETAADSLAAAVQDARRLISESDVRTDEFEQTPAIFTEIGRAHV